MNTPRYQVGGSLPADSPSYVERKADQQFQEALLAGKFCYVLAARQMGKSSLMVRAKARLKQQSVHTAVVNLSTPSDDSRDRWYRDVVDQLARSLSLEELKPFWQNRSSVGVAMRFVDLLAHALTRLKQPLVVFLDEVDSMLRLGHRDDFFAAIRSCFNARAEEGRFRGLTIAVLGVASPNQLIADPERTPFNIGERIELTDFTRDEAAKLLDERLTTPDNFGALLDAVLAWTGGHPYLTHALCAKLASSKQSVDQNVVDSVVEELFLQNRTEANLLWLRERLQDNQPLLAIYRRVLRGKRITYHVRDPLHVDLMLSGITVDRDGALAVRNRIYRTVFDLPWLSQRRSELSFWYRWRWPIAAASTVALLSSGAGIYWLSRPERRQRSASEIDARAVTVWRKQYDLSLDTDNQKRLAGSGDPEASAKLDRLRDQTAGLKARYHALRSELGSVVWGDPAPGWHTTESHTWTYVEHPSPAKLYHILFRYDAVIAAPATTLGAFPIHTVIDKRYPGSDRVYDVLSLRDRLSVGGLLRSEATRDFDGKALAALSFPIAGTWTSGEDRKFMLRNENASDDSECLQFTFHFLDEFPPPTSPRQVHFYFGVEPGGLAKGAAPKVAYQRFSQGPRTRPEPDSFVADRASCTQLSGESWSSARRVTFDSLASGATATEGWRCDLSLPASDAADGGPMLLVYLQPPYEGCRSVEDTRDAVRKAFAELE